MLWQKLEFLQQFPQQRIFQGFLVAKVSGKSLGYMHYVLRREGREADMKRGVKFGRPKKLSPEQKELILSLPFADKFLS